MTMDVGPGLSPCPECQGVVPGYGRRLCRRLDSDQFLLGLPIQAMGITRRRIGAWTCFEWTPHLLAPLRGKAPGFWTRMKGANGVWSSAVGKADDAVACGTWLDAEGDQAWRSALGWLSASHAAPWRAWGGL